MITSSIAAGTSSRNRQELQAAIVPSMTIIIAIIAIKTIIMAIIINYLI